jgi:ParB family transcriptional regulator, chromosome partitioning protein
MTRKRDRPYGLDVSPVTPLDMLFQDDAIPAAEFVAIEQIQVSLQPRRYFDPEKQAQLTESVKQYGILEPLIVRSLDDGRYGLIAGERRYRAAQSAGLTEVPVVIREMDDIEALHISLIENLQRDDLNPFDETESILKLLSIRLNIDLQDVPALLYQMKNAIEKSSTVSQPASPSNSPSEYSEAKNHDSRNNSARNNVIPNAELSAQQEVTAVFNELGRMSWLSFTCNRLPLLRLDAQVLDALRQGKLAYTKAMAIARVKDEQSRRSLLEQAITENLSLAAIRRQIRMIRSADPTAQSATTRTASESSTQTLKQRMKCLYQQSQRSLVLATPATQKKIDRLLTQLEALLSDKKV